MAIQSLLMIIGILAILLVIGVPISYSIGIASLVTISRPCPWTSPWSQAPSASSWA